MSLENGGGCSLLTNEIGQIRPQSHNKLQNIGSVGSYQFIKSSWKNGVMGVQRVRGLSRNDQIFDPAEPESGGWLE